MIAHYNIDVPESWDDDSAAPKLVVQGSWEDEDVAPVKRVEKPSTTQPGLYIILLYFISQNIV